MVGSSIRYQTFPTTLSPPPFVKKIVEVFKMHERDISTDGTRDGLNSDEVLARLRPDLQALKFEVETSVKSIRRPVLYGENGEPRVSYEIDAYHPGWQAVLEVEAGRAWMGNAVYRDLVHAMVMVDTKFLILAVPNTYRYKSSGKQMANPDYAKANDLIDTLYKQTDLKLPYNVVLVGY